MDDDHYHLLPVSKAAPLAAGAPLTIGIDEEGAVPPDVASCFDILLTTAKNPSHEWLSVDSIPEVMKSLLRQIENAPIAANALAQLLRLGDMLSFEQALVAESLTYSTLLAGEEFRRWRKAHSSNPPIARNSARLRLERENDVFKITLSRPERRNAVDAQLRDELVEALLLPALDDSIRQVELRGEGPCFSSGGDLSEFGTAGDLGAAHAIRIEQSPVRDIHRLASRITAFLHGACIGSGIEIPLAAGKVVAAPDTSFRLPEISMGLVPGAGGTVSIPRRIGRHRTCFLALSNQQINAETALGWGLVDRIGPAS